MSSSTKLTASYASPTNNTHVFSAELPSVSATCSVEEKTAFVAAVRASASQMQDDINAMLTQRMEEDKAQESAIATKSAKDEEREEEMYGEEDVGDE